MLVGAVAIVLCVLSAAWHENFGEVTYLYRLAVVSAVTALCVLLASGRWRVHRDRERFGLLAAVAEIADGTLTPRGHRRRAERPRRADVRRHLHRRCRQPGRAAAPGRARRRRTRRRHDARRPPTLDHRRAGRSRAAAAAGGRRRRPAAAHRGGPPRPRAAARARCDVGDHRAAARPRAATRLADADRHTPLRPPLRRGGPRVRAGALRPRGARPRQRRSVLRARDDRGAADRRAVDARRGRDGPAPRWHAAVRQRCGREDARLRQPAGAAGHPGRARWSIASTQPTRTGRRCASSSCPVAACLRARSPSR